MGTHWTVDRVRAAFIDYFVSKRSHVFVPSSPCVPLDDPTLLFTNAGMNQFKPIFLGQADPNSDLGRLRRAANSQKCIRAGGKHNDLDDVGKDTYHHTFFEMLGNWSFGEYFKQEAVDWSWELLTKVYALSPDRLYATYFEGNPRAGLEPDHETRALWLKYLPPERVLPGNMKDNFWEMGETGPCGPCTEIHYDRIGPQERGRFVPELVNAGDPDLIEIWNNVFIQFNREDAGTLKPLPARHVDTGMGLERLTSILQNKRSNYDTDVFMPIFARIEQLTNPPHGYTGRLGAADTGNVDTAYRVIADHIRTLTFAITDGALPSNVGRGYVLRRILRRAVRFGRQVLGARTGFFAQLVPTVVERFGHAFPELNKDPARVAAVIHEEEESFGKTLDRGIKLFEEVAARSPISGDDAFKLYDTYGFPIDLTVQMAEERGLKVDVAGFEAAMEAAKERSRAVDAKDEAKALTLPGDAVARLKHLHIDATDDHHKFQARDLVAHVRAIWTGEHFDEHARVTLSQRSRTIGIVTDRTPFYATMGGQECDAGRIVVVSESRAHAHDRHEGGEFVVESVQAFGGYVLHIGRVTHGEIRVGDSVSMQIDKLRRARIAGNHTGTHLANFALRAVLGDGVDQKGSLVAPDRFRFDFSHAQPVSPDELRRIEEIVGTAIRQDLTVYAEPAPLAAAREISGLRAVFGETYPDPVRVVSIGQPVSDLVAGPANPAWRELSVEFCGGTHVERTALLASFAVVGEEAVAKGIRRIVALTGEPAEAAQAAGIALERRVAEAAGARDIDLPNLVQGLLADLDAAVCSSWRKAQVRAGIASLQERVKAAEKAMGAAMRDEAVRLARSIAQSAQAANDQVIVTTLAIGDDRAALQAAVKTVRDICTKSAVMLVCVDEGAGKVGVCAMVPDWLVQKGLRAGDWVRDTCALLGGKGGGKPDSAQGGGTDIAKVSDAIKAARVSALTIAMK
ncbi:MAG: alanine--tRNA ligase [Planctomycetota bacterium]|nr:alanine--tRNA ligase [Planctomycetota bacterium]